MPHDILVLTDLIPSLIPSLVAVILCIVAAYLFNARYTENCREFSIGEYIFRTDTIVAWSAFINGIITVVFIAWKVSTKPEFEYMLNTTFLYALPIYIISEWTVMIGLYEIGYVQKYSKPSAPDILSFVYEVADGRVYLSLDIAARSGVKDYYFRHFHERNNRVGVIRAANFYDMIEKLGGKRTLIAECDHKAAIAVTRKNRKLIKEIFSA